MSITVSEYIDVCSRAKELGLSEPGDLVFLPRNFAEAASKEDFVYEASLPDMKLLLREAGIEFGKLEPDDTKPRLVKENAFDWTLPTLFITAAAFYKANQETINLILAKIWDHSKIVFAAVTGRTRVKWDVVVEEDGDKKTKRISFEGPAEELSKVREFLDKVLKEKKEKQK